MKRLYFLKIGLLLVIFFFIIQATAYSAIIRVKPGGNDASSGASWALAKKTVTAAINAANAGDEIWVAAGTYAEHIQIAKELAVYGGFAGTETARNQRDLSVNLTALNGSGSGTVVTFTGGVGPNTRVDGFAITGGSSGYGGGISISGSSPTIAYNLIKLNMATTYGGGIFCSDSSPSIIFNSILWNFSEDDGGGISCWRNSSPLIANNHIIGNVSNYTDGASDTSVGGGGIFATAADLDGRPQPTAVASPTIINNVIAANGGDSGAGIRINDLNGGTATITNNTVVANSGTGIYWQREFSNTSVVISNNVVAFNTWGLQQRGTTSFQIRFNDIYGNSLFDERTDYVALSDQTGVNGNISIDPQLVNYKFGNFHLQSGSPCKDAGSTGDVNTGWTDIDGQNRIMGTAVDIGADESDGTVWSTTFPILHVKPNGNDNLDGLTWATAKRTLGAAIFAAPSTGWEVWVAEGTYSEHIFIVPFVYLYGGFNGTEVSRGSRNVSANRTIIDGGGNKTIVASVNTGYLVSALDGFTIQNGGVYTAGGGTNPYGVGGFGGGIYINVSSPLIANNLIRWNSLAFDNTPVFPQPPSYGGGIYSRLSYAIISGNTITENEILNYFDGKGAGIYCSFSGLMIRYNTIAQNHSRYGSAIYCTTSAPYILGNLIENNAMYNTYPLPLYSGSATGAINLDDGPDFIIQDNTIRGNTASTGAGVYVSNNKAGRIPNNIIVNNNAAGAAPGSGGMGGGIYCYAPLDAVRSHSLVNNTIVDNTATGILGEQGGGIAVSILPPIFTPPVPIPDRIVIANNIIAFNSSGIFQTLTSPMVPPTLTKNDIFDTGSHNYYINLSAGATDIHVDPLFVNRTGGDFYLLLNSPCIDAGSNAAVPIWLTTDFEGNPRIFHGNVDIGALEFYPPNLVDFVTKYYNDILDRPPEPGGAESWTAEIDRIVSLGIDIKEGFIAVGKVFFNSPEYLSMGKTDTAYVLDLYRTFLNRVPAQFEVDSWLDCLTQGVSRNVVLNFFVFSPEFNTYMGSIFGMSTARPENNLVNDFYRGILSRLPDTAGFNYWLNLMRAAQCSGSAQQVRDLSYQIASLFVGSPEYVARGRTNSKYVEDLYDAILRRTAAPWEVNYWVNYLSTATREQALQGFTDSNEFQTRVQAVIDAGCL